MYIQRTGKSPQKLSNLALFIKSWRPIEGWYILEPNGNYSLPTHHSQLGKRFYTYYKRSVVRSLYVLLLAALLMVGIFVTSPNWYVAKHAALLAGLLIFAAMDRVLSINSYENCKQKIEFLYDLQRAFQHLGVVYIPFFVVIIVIQWGASTFLGGYEALVIHYGTYYPSIELDSLWRFAIGPLIHADIKHWLVNAILTLLFASMAPILWRRVSFGLCLGGAIVSHVAAFITQPMMSISYDAIVGISGGAYALLAYAFSYYCGKGYFNIAFSLLTLFVFSELSVTIIANHTSHAAHISGFIVGIITYVACKQSTKPLSKAT
jgi:hypothetical protein